MYHFSTHKCCKSACLLLLCGRWQMGDGAEGGRYGLCPWGRCRGWLHRTPHGGLDTAQKRSLSAALIGGEGRLSWWDGSWCNGGLEKRGGDSFKKMWCLSWASNHNRQSQEDTSSREYRVYKGFKRCFAYLKTYFEMVRALCMPCWEAGGK